MENEKIWETLLDAIDQKRVVPIIGDEFFYAKEGDELVNYKQFLLKELVKRVNPPKELTPDFNMIADLIKVNNQMQSLMGVISNATTIYYEIGDIVRNTPVVCDQCLVDFLSTFHFPLVLSTSFIPGMESLIGVDRLTTKAYDKTPRIDISSINPQCTILYYLFGKCSKANKTYMVTEDDLLDYMHLWHNIETRPRNLSEYLSDKFLLLLGCNYPNWLFRFFWHSIKNFNLLSGNEGLKGIVASSMLNTDNELSRFLSRIQTHTYANGKVFMNELKSRRRIDDTSISEKKNEDDKENEEDLCDVFLSYSHKDFDVVARIADVFEKYGAKVWFDSTALKGSDLYDKIIQDKISECQRFVPVISSTTELERRGYFRKEWYWVLEELKFRLGSPYIAPITIDNIDYGTSTMPREFKDAHILSYRSDDFENEIKRLIRSFRQ